MRISGRKAGLAGVLALLFAVVPVAAAGQAQAVPLLPSFGSGHVYNGGSPRCLDSGTPTGALLFNCSTSAYQQWVYNTRTGRFTGNSPTGCLDERAGTDGSRVFLNTCNGSASQTWYGDPNGGTFVNAASGKCLDADLGTIGGQATIVQVYRCSGWSNQIWWFEFVSS